MAGNRDATGYLKTGIVRKLRSEFNTTRVPGITSIPLVIQDRPLNNVPYPYIYIDVSDVEEIDVTKDSSAYEYTATIEVCNKTTQQEDGKRTRDAITDEVVNILNVGTDEYIDLSGDGFDIYVQTVESPDPIPSINAHGSTYWKTEIDVIFRITFVGTPQELGPIQNPIFTFDGFELTPVSNNIEFGDSGTVTGSLSYPSNNNGYDFTTVNYALSSGSQGSLAANVLTVGAENEPLSIDTTINYEFGTDDTVTTSLEHTTVFSRIRSFRYGSSTSSSFSSADLDVLSDFTGTNKTFDFGNVDPTGETIDVSGNAGEYIYFIMPSGINPTIENRFGADITNIFNNNVVSGHRVLVSQDPIIYDGSTFRYTIA